MPKPLVIQHTSSNDFLSNGELRQVVRSILGGGLAIVPSDTTWACCMLPFDARNSRLLDLWTGNREPRNLAFASTEMMERFVHVRRWEYRLLDSLTPGPLTIVMDLLDRPEASQMATAVHTQPRLPHEVPAISVRIPSSTVEVQISAAIQQPVTTVALRDPRTGRLATTDSEMRDIVDAIRALLPVEIDLTIIHGRRRMADDRLSTIVRFPTGADVPLIIRPGELTEEDIMKPLKASYSPREFEDWT